MWFTKEFSGRFLGLSMGHPGYTRFRHVLSCIVVCYWSTIKFQNEDIKVYIRYQYLTCICKPHDIDVTSTFRSMRIILQDGDRPIFSMDTKNYRGSSLLQVVYISIIVANYESLYLQISSFMLQVMCMCNEK
jgi:hypothetical protein